MKLLWFITSEYIVITCMTFFSFVFDRSWLVLLVYWGLTPQQQPGSYQGGEMIMMKSVFWWRKPEYPEETTDLRQVTDETYHTVMTQNNTISYVVYIKTFCLCVVTSVALCSSIRSIVGCYHSYRDRVPSVVSPARVGANAVCDNLPIITIVSTVSTTTPYIMCSRWPKSKMKRR